MRLPWQLGGGGCTECRVRMGFPKPVFGATPALMLMGLVPGMQENRCCCWLPYSGVGGKSPVPQKKKRPGQSQGKQLVESELAFPAPNFNLGFML